MASTDDLYTALQSLTRQLEEQNNFVRQQLQAQERSQPQGVQWVGAPTRSAGASTSQAGPNLPPPLAQMGLRETWQDFSARRQSLIDNPAFSGNAAAAALSQFAPAKVTQSAPQSNVVPGGTLNASLPQAVQAPPGANHMNQGIAQAMNNMAGGMPPVASGANPYGHGGVDPNQAITFAMLGEHGAPAWMRNAAMGTYGIQQSLNWAQNGANWVQNQSWMPNAVKGAMGPMQGMLNIAQNNPLATYAGVQALRTITGTIGTINAHAQNAQALGESFGMQTGQPFGPRSLFGIRNPLADVGGAAGVGYAFDALKHQLEGQIPGGGWGGMGAGLTGQQAQSALDVIGNLGFSDNAISMSNLLNGGGTTGNATEIAQGLFRPVMNAVPGLNAQEIGQFTNSLRNAGTSVDTVRNQLMQLGVEAHATSMNVNQFASEVKSAGEGISTMGASTQGSTNLVQGFQNITGIQGAPLMAQQLAQNSMVQGMALGQYGVLPSAIGDMNPGAFASTSMQTAQMLNSALAGIDHNVYRNINGVRTLVSSGAQARTDQIAKMLGIPSNQVKAMLGEGGRTMARSNLQAVLGSQGSQGTGGTGLWADIQGGSKHLDSAQMAKFNHDWNTGIVQHLAGTGISKAQIDKLSSISDPRKRLEQLNQLMASTQSNNGLNTVQKREDTQTVKVEFTGAAARYFQALNTQPTIAKNRANAGGPAYNAVLNQPGGDPQKVTSIRHPIAR